MPTIEDPEFGTIQVRKSSRSTRISIKISLQGGLQLSAPTYIPVFVLKRFIGSSRDKIRKLYHQSLAQGIVYEDGMQIGKSHTLVVRAGAQLKVQRQKLQIVVFLPSHASIHDQLVQLEIKKSIVDALRREAKGYLPKRLRYLAEKHHLSYEKVRFSHAGSRWGSCSSTGTISLNIALMKLPFALIDYVIIHELAHTVHLNHSSQFWHTVGLYDPHYQVHRAALKQESPSI